MRALSIALTCATLALLLPAVLGVSSGTQYFRQRLDHFDALNNQTWQQRFTVNSTFYKQNGPIFFYLSGEAPMEFFEFQEVGVYTWAQQFNAMVIVLEHRFYGNSMPTRDLSTINLRFLSSEQALSDAAAFLVSFNQTLSSSGMQPGKWIVFGCSYSGGLSAWFRAKFPYLVAGSIAPSGPVYALLNFTGFFGQFSVSAAQYPGCVSAVQTSVAAISNLLSTASGRQQLDKTFNTCTPLNNDNALYFKFALTGSVGGAPQWENPPFWLLRNVCKIFTTSTDPVQAFADAATYSNNFDPANGPQTPLGVCNEYSRDAAIAAMHVIGKRAGVASSRAWEWQTCTEFGYYQGSYQNTSIFWSDLDVNSLVSMCAEVYDIPNLTPDTTWTNAFYGGYNLQGDNILFTNGLYDGWHLLSIINDNAYGVEAVTYEAAHCASLIAPTPQDPPSLLQARQAVVAHLDKWINS